MKRQYAHPAKKMFSGFIDEQNMTDHLKNIGSLVLKMTRKRIKSSSESFMFSLFLKEQHFNQKMMGEQNAHPIKKDI